MSDLDAIFDKAKESLAGFERLQTDTKLALEKSKRELEEVNAALAEARSKHQGLLSELAAKKSEADASSEEAARRIRTGNEQVAELMRVKNELDQRETEVAKKEQAISEREKNATDLEKKLTADHASYTKRWQALVAKEQKMREALA